MLPPNNKVLCSHVKDYTRWGVFSKPPPVLKWTSEQKGNCHLKRKKISILSVAGLIFSDSICFQSSWFKLSLYSHWRKTGTSRQLRILSLLETSLGMGSHTEQYHSLSSSGSSVCRVIEVSRKLLPKSTHLHGHKCAGTTVLALIITLITVMAFVLSKLEHGTKAESHTHFPWWQSPVWSGSGCPFPLTATETDPVCIEVTWFLSIKIHSFNLCFHFRI